MDLLKPPPPGSTPAPTQNLGVGMCRFPGPHRCFRCTARAEATGSARAVSGHRWRPHARLQRTAGGVGAVLGPEGPLRGRRPGGGQPHRLLPLTTGCPVGVASLGLYQPWLWLAGTLPVSCTTLGGTIHAEYDVHGSASQPPSRIRREFLVLPVPQSGPRFPLSGGGFCLRTHHSSKGTRGKAVERRGLFDGDGR